MFGFEVFYENNKKQEEHSTSKTILLIKKEKALLIKGEEPKETGRWSMRKRGTSS